MTSRFHHEFLNAFGRPGWLVRLADFSALRRTVRVLLGMEYKPFIPSRVDHGILTAQVADYFHIGPDAARRRYKEYAEFHAQKGYEATLGERTTLCFEEAFVLYAAAATLRPSRVVEIGTQYGGSTRRIIDMLELLDLDAEITCFDVLDQVKHFSTDEARLVVRDVTGNFTESVLRDLKPDLIYLDAHPYALLKAAISEFLEWEPRCALAVHDCTHGLYNPRMTLAKDDVGGVSSLTGVWERHVLSEVFHVSERELDDIATPMHRLRVFETPHGLAMISRVGTFRH